MSLHLKHCLFFALALATLGGAAVAEPPRPPEPASPNSTLAEITRRARDSVVVISVTGRDGEQQQLGAGFVISADGLIATNNHVIGEARPIRVTFADKQRYDVAEVHATDRARDLAIIRIDAKDLPTLELGDSDKLQQGQQVLAIGNPLGLKHSVVSGVVSGKREIGGQKMIQLAIPVEQGNSGGPILDRQGRVQGIVTMKSAVTKNLGFAAEINALKSLIESPNPIPMSRWLTIGKLSNRWKPLFGARWTQRAGRIFVEGAGEGFGGRSLCLWQQDPPKRPFEIEATVRLNDESGAAGLVFQADGGDRHYGFYPSSGRLRLSRFDGPSVFTWQVLADVESEHYRRGDSNHLRVRLEKEKILCYINGHLVIESTDNQLPPGKVGLAKFRHTEAQFKGFRVGKELPDTGPSPEQLAEIESLIGDLPPLESLGKDDLRPLAKLSHGAGLKALRERAKELERQAAQLRRIADDVHIQRVSDLLREAVAAPDEEIDLGRAALLIALLDDDEVDVEAYLAEIERMDDELKERVGDNQDEAARLKALGDYLFAENGFHGSRTDYYHQANSYLNRVIDDREGLPITLSVLYMELGRRLGLNIEGVGLPGHFIVRFVPSAPRGYPEPQLIDVFHGAKPMTREEAERQVRAAGQSFDEEHLRRATNKSILVRMLMNLLGIAQGKSDREAMLRYLEVIVALEPTASRERGMRAILRHQTGRRAAALADLDWFLENQPEGVDLERIREMRAAFEANSVSE